MSDQARGAKHEARRTDEVPQFTLPDDAFPPVRPLPPLGRLVHEGEFPLLYAAGWTGFGLLIGWWIWA